MKGRRRKNGGGIVVFALLFVMLLGTISETLAAFTFLALFFLFIILKIIAAISRQFPDVRD